MLLSSFVHLHHTAYPTPQLLSGFAQIPQPVSDKIGRRILSDHVNVIHYHIDVISPPPPPPLNMEGLPRGRPRERCTDQVRPALGIAIATLWKQAILQGHGWNAML